MVIHRRTRLGCKQCKLRKVKCKLARPSCQNCQTYGVECIYLDTRSTTQLTSRIERQPLMLPKNIQNLARINLGGVISQIIGSSGTSDQNSSRIAGLVDDFHRSIVLTIGSPPIVAVYQREIVHLALSHPCLMHTILWLSMYYKRIMGLGKSNAEELQHSQSAIAFFNQAISKPILDEQRDAVFATATLLNTIFLASVDMTNPRECWPMYSTIPLQWLRLQAGVALTIGAARPNRPGGLFAELFQYVERDIEYPAVPAFRDFFNVEKGSPYLRSVQMLEPLLALESTPYNVMYYVPFIGRMSVEFIELLEMRDIQALLLLGIWYSLVIDSGQWWLVRRATVELAAIEIYLTERGAATPTDVRLLVSASIT